MKNTSLSHKPLFFEKNAWSKNLLVCGIDEVGRGCLAGPLVVSAVIIPINSRLELLKDSKVLTAAQRLKAYKWIIETCLYSNVILSPKEVDRLNIYQATLRAMKRSYISLIESYGVQLENIQYVLVDAMPLKIETSFIHKSLEIKHFNYGEQISPSIAAASIVAKVTRDNLMNKINHIFPTMHMNQHKGYGTKLHQDSIRQYGASIIHRKTFLKTQKLNTQQNIFGDFE